MLHKAREGATSSWSSLQLECRSPRRLVASLSAVSAGELDQGAERENEDDDTDTQQEQQDAHHHVDPPEPDGSDGNAAANPHVDCQVGCKHHALGGVGAALVGARPHAFVTNLQHMHARVSNSAVSQR